MARGCSVNRFYGALISILLASCSSATTATPRSGTSGSSMLDDANRVVPGFITHYAPLIWLHSEDPFRPADLLQHIRHTSPAVDHKSIPDVPELVLDNLAILNDVSSGQVALTAVDDVTTLPTWLYGETPDGSGKTQNATSCVVVLVERGPIDIDAFYFYFYSYDRGPNLTQVAEPVNRLVKDDGSGTHFGDHVGDWEHNMVRFHDGKPTGIWYSQHRDGAVYQWGDAGLSLENDRPIVFSAYGSHANYASAGDHIHDEALIDYCDAGPRWDPILSAYFYHLDPTSFILTQLSPPESSLPPTHNITSFFYYTGLWGDTQYPDDDPRQKTVPHFGIKRFVSGPTGPATKQLVRKGIAPDEGKHRSWTEWAVGVVMSLYPCCIRGWRKWVWGVVLLGVLLSVPLGIWYALRQYKKRRGYKRVETDVQLDDLNWREDSSPSRSETELRRME